MRIIQEQFTDEELQFIRDNWRRMIVKDIAAALGRNICTVYAKGINMGIGNKKMHIERADIVAAYKEHKIVERGYHVDFNQGLDARLVTPDIADLLAKVKWIKNIRFGCDTPKQVEECQRVVDMLNERGFRENFLFYTMLHGEMQECYDRLMHWSQQGNRYNVQAQPYINLKDLSHRPPQWQKDMARWANRKQLFHTCDFKDFSPRKGFKCSEYFKGQWYKNTPAIPKRRGGYSDLLKNTHKQ